ncbi:hypothetical protein [Trichocoleus sp. FACHB-262]|uniref:hypothetical protein n=1 Tax=Trichocoleus sp. FACHB-262 TaxID=2692869 RepID=UPI0016880B08|nr:hypothetical protein [Trichocoleus sp. FACHB-262]MBD2124154.1 hypothetical protein [Trichocoleus sp. FACHB-262]
MTNKQREFAKAQPFVTHPSAFLGTPLTYIVLPLCGGVVGEAIAPSHSSESSISDKLEAEEQLVPATAPTVAKFSGEPTQTSERAMTNLCKVAIALLIFGSILGWLTTVPMWLPQFFPKPYSATSWCVHFYSNSRPLARLNIS